MDKFWKSQSLLLEHIWGSEDPSSSLGTSVVERSLGYEFEPLTASDL